MLSVVSVFNNRAKLQARLLRGLARQKTVHELILVDNQDGRFSGAAAALNWGARQAKGPWIIFLHQDVELLLEDWLCRAEGYLQDLDAEGCHGVVGRNSEGRWRGVLRDRAMIFGESFDRPVQVQTLDESVLMLRNHGPNHPYFDERIPGWHAYGVDACCSAIRAGAQNFVLPLAVWHDSDSKNRTGIRQAHAHVWLKHAGAFRRIYTTCGVLPHAYGWSGSYRIATWLRRVRGWAQMPWRWPAGCQGVFQRSPWEILEEWTCHERAVDCLHSPAPFPALEGSGFTDFTGAPRRIVHHFTGLALGSGLSDCVVIAPELARDLHSLEQLPRTLRRLIVCLYIKDPVARPKYWRRLLGLPLRGDLAIESDQTRWVMLEALL